MKEQRYKSKVDLWLALVLAGVPVLMIVLGVLALSHSATAGWIQIGVSVFVGGLIVALSYPCDYTLGETDLRIRCGIINETIPYSKIRKAELSNAAWSAPALSLSRIKLTTEDGTQLISPLGREVFLKELLSRLEAKAPCS